MSPITKKLRKKKYILLAISIMLNVIPMLYFVIEGFVKGDTKEKVCLSLTGTMALFFLVLNVLFKSHLKRTIFIVILTGIYIAMKDMKIVFIVLGLSTVADELIISPLYSYYKDKVSNNKDIDKRLGE